MLITGLRGLFRRDDVVLTRDIVVAYAYALMGGVVIYEMHRQPETLIAKHLIASLSKYRKAGFIAISKAMA